jgi:hypothetical protein
MTSLPRHPIDAFMEALHAKKRVRVKFYSAEDSTYVARTCAPMDYGRSRRAKDPTPRYHFWDFTSDERPHTLSLRPEQLLSIEILESQFDPATFVTWRPAWIVPRDWGPYS